MESFKSRLAIGAGWIASARVVINVSGFISTIILARYLTPEDFGLVAIAMTIMMVVGAFTDLPVGAALVQRPVLEVAHFDSAWTIGFIRGVVLAALLAAMAWPVAHVYNDPRLMPVMLVLALTSIIPNVGNPKIANMSRELVFWQEFVLTSAGKIVGLAVAAFIAITYQNYWALILSSMAAQLITMILSYFLIPYIPKFDLSKFKDLLSFSFWMSLGQVINTLNWRSDQLFISYFLSPAKLGIYSFADNLSSLPTREATAPVAKTLFPAFSRMSGDLPRLRAAYARAQSILCGLAFPLGFGFAAVAEPIVQISVGNKWLEAVPIIQVLSGLFAVITIVAPLQPLAMATGNTKTLFFRDLSNLIIRLPLVLSGLWLGGLLGAVIARCLSSAIGSIIMMVITKKLIDLSVVDQMLGVSRYLVASLVMYAFVTICGGAVQHFEYDVHVLFRLLVMVGAGVVAYSLTSCLLWLLGGKKSGLEEEVFAVLRKFISKFQNLKIFR